MCRVTFVMSWELAGETATPTQAANKVPDLDYNGFYPPGARPPYGKYMELLINAKTYVIDALGIGNDVVETDGLRRVSSYEVN